MNKFSSMFQVPRTDIMTAATFALLCIQRRRDELLEEAIQHEMTKWFFPARSREVAEKRVARYTFPHRLWEMSGWGTEMQAQRLLDAAGICADETALLSAEDAQFVHEWLRRRSGEQKKS